MNVLADSLKSYQPRRKEWPTAGSPEAVLQSHRPVSDSDGEPGYIGAFEITDDHRAGKMVGNLTGRLNKCGVISPRFDVQLRDLEKWQNNLLPSRQYGFLVLTASVGIMDHGEARRNHTGGKILAFFF